MRALAQSSPRDADRIQQSGNLTSPISADTGGYRERARGHEEAHRTVEAELRKHQAAEQPVTAIHHCKATATMVRWFPVDSRGSGKRGLLPASTQPTKKRTAEPFAFADTLG